MADRRPLIDGLKSQAPPIAPELEKAFVFAGKAATPDVPAASSPPPSPTQPAATAPSRVPISTRMRTDFAAALKRASLERQLGNVEPSTLQDILEQAIEPWLRSNGYLP